MKLRRILILVAFLTGGIGALFADTFTVETGQFQKLKINGNISIVYRNLPDSTGFARYTGDPDDDDLFSFTTKNDGSLKIEPADEKWGNNDLPVVYLYSDFLTSVESYSDREVEIEDVAPCASFNVTQVGNGYISVEGIRSNNVTAAITTGNGTINLAGVCVNANFRMVGTGMISADRLQADNVKCRILGTGNIGCWPVENLKVTGLGSTKIYYKGSPNIKKTGGGKLFQLPEDPMDKSGTAVPSLAPNAAMETKGRRVNAVEVEEEEKLVTVSAEEDEEDDEEEEEETDDYDDDDDYQTVVTEDD